MFTQDSKSTLSRKLFTTLKDLAHFFRTLKDLAIFRTLKDFAISHKGFGPLPTTSRKMPLSEPRPGAHVPGGAPCRAHQQPQLRRERLQRGSPGELAQAKEGK